MTGASLFCECQSNWLHFNHTEFPSVESERKVYLQFTHLLSQEPHSNALFEPFSHEKGFEKVNVNLIKKWLHSLGKNPLEIFNRAALYRLLNDLIVTEPKVFLLKRIQLENSKQD